MQPKRCVHDASGMLDEMWASEQSRCEKEGSDLDKVLDSNKEMRVGKAWFDAVMLCSAAVKSQIR